MYPTISIKFSGLCVLDLSGCSGNNMLSAVKKKCLTEASHVKNVYLTDLNSEKAVQGELRNLTM